MFLENLYFKTKDSYTRYDYPRIKEKFKFFVRSVFSYRNTDHYCTDSLSESGYRRIGFECEVSVSLLVPWTS